MIYLLLLISAYLIYKELKDEKTKRKLIFAYASIFAIAFVYNVGEIVGAGLYHLGMTV